jgi:hypothetical protein
VRVLLDERLPQGLKNDLVSHDVALSSVSVVSSIEAIPSAF